MREGHIVLVGEELLLKDSHWFPGASGGDEVAPGRRRLVVLWFCEHAGHADGYLGPDSGEHWWMPVSAFSWRPDPWNDGNWWSLLFRVG